MKRAVIDLGTNTFNLLIGEVVNGQFCRIYSDKMSVLLGMGGINQGIITPDAMERAKDALRHFMFLCYEMDVDDVLGVGTSALRAAKNSKELIDFSRNELDLEIEIVSGKKEAQLIYQGVKWLHDFEKDTVIMDIGGGSTEFIHVQNNDAMNAVSLDVGVSRIYQYLEHPEDFTPEHFEKINRFLAKNEGDFFNNSKSSILIGASGSFETLYKLSFHADFPKDNRTVEVPKKRLDDVIESILYSSLEDRMSNSFISPIRKRMLPIAAFKVKWVMEKLATEQVFISPYSLKEGVFMER